MAETLASAEKSHAGRFTQALGAGEGPAVVAVRARTEAAHAAQLTRDEITASVLYVRWELSAAEVASLATGPVALVCDNAAYAHRAPLDERTVAELLIDLRR